MRICSDGSGSTSAADGTIPPRDSRVRSLGRVKLACRLSDNAIPTRVPSRRCRTQNACMKCVSAIAPAARSGEALATPVTMEPIDELLHAISDVLDVRDIFPRIAEIAGRVVPHECLTLTVGHDSGAVECHAASQQGFPEDREC